MLTDEARARDVSAPRPSNIIVSGGDVEASTALLVIVTSCEARLDTVTACDNEVLFDSFPELATITTVSATCMRFNAAAAAAISASSGEMYFIDEITSVTLSSAEVTLTITPEAEEARGVDVTDICEELTGMGECVINIGVANGGVCDEESDEPTLGVGEGELVGVEVIVGVGLVDNDAPSETVAVCVGVIVGVVDEVSVAEILEFDENELVKVFIEEPLIIILPVLDKLANFEPDKIADICADCDCVGVLDSDNRLDFDELVEPDDEALDEILIVIGE
jgi:hypothetical protein